METNNEKTTLTGDLSNFANRHPIVSMLIGVCAIAGVAQSTKGHIDYFSKDTSPKYVNSYTIEDARKTVSSDLKGLEADVVDLDKDGDFEITTSMGDSNYLVSRGSDGSYVLRKYDLKKSTVTTYDLSSK